MSAQRGRRPGFVMGHFYVYTFRVAGEVVYVGKGSGSRLNAQVKAFRWLDGGIGGIVRFFVSERAAYDHEARLIQKHCPRYNVNKGGGGALSRVKQPRLSAYERHVLQGIKRLGTQKFVARELLKFDIFPHIGAEKFASLVRVGYGDELAC